VTANMTESTEPEEPKAWDCQFDLSAEGRGLALNRNSLSMRAVAGGQDRSGA
jgi:hypothetical protein